MVGLKAHRHKCAKCHQYRPCDCASAKKINWWCLECETKFDAHVRRAFRGKWEGVKALILIAWLFVAGQAGASCGEYTFCNNELDYHVPQNLIRLLKGFEEDQMAAFFRKLGCWSGGDDYYGEIRCEADGQEFTYEWKREDDYKPEALLIMVAAESAEVEWLSQIP